MRKSHISFTATFVSVLMAASPAWADCSTKDLAGRYQLYASWVDEGVYGWTRCILSVKDDGNIKNGTKCVDDDGFADTVTGGSLAITKTCLVTGRINTTDGDALIDHARFNLDRSILIGVGRDADTFSDAIITFTAQRL